ncbi:MAG: PH domain-containing protein [Candidatus Dormibacteraeota bacterium]|nr:PH domain-containing protein [Candidatus Dormibacteraeota bacterium]
MPDTLLQDEDLKVRVHQHWVLLLHDLTVPLLIVLAILVLDGATVDRLAGELRLALLLAALGLLGLWTIVVYARWAATALTVTDRRVLFESGVFSRVTKVVALDRVQDVTTRQPLMGRMLGYGTLEISSAGLGGAEVATHVPFPQAVRDEIFVQAGRQRRQGSF